MIGTILIIVSVIVIVALWCSLSIGAASDERIQRALIIHEAQRRYPNIPLSVALDRLYCETLREIKRLHAQHNYDTQELEDRLILIFNERNHWLQQELEAESNIA